MDLNEEIERLIAKAEAERDRLDAQIRALRSALGQPATLMPQTTALSTQVAPTGGAMIGARFAKSTSWRGQRNATRNAILEIMADGRSRRVGEIARTLGKTSNATSAAVRGLRATGHLVQNGKQGYYKIAPPAGAQDPETVPSTSTPTREEALSEPLGQRLGEAAIVGAAGLPGAP